MSELRRRILEPWSILFEPRGALCAVVVVLGIASVAAGGRNAGLVEIQLGTDADHVQELLANRARVRAARRAIEIDYAFIAAYLAAFVTLAVVLLRRGDWWAGLGVAAAAAALATAALDLIENVRTTGVLGYGPMGQPLPQAKLDALRAVSLAKWAASALTIALLGAIFVQPRWLAGIAVAFLGIALIGFVGLFRHALIQPFFMGVFAATVFIAVFFLAWPESVTRAF